MKRAVVVAIALLLGASCIPIQVSKECQDQISDCLKDCRPVSGDSSPDLGGHDDSRNDCERHCHSICK